MTTIVIYGDLAEGHTFVGPFENAELAAEYLAKDGGEGQIVTLHPPADEFATANLPDEEVRHLDDYDPEQHQHKTLDSFSYNGTTFVAEESVEACKGCVLDRQNKSGLYCLDAPRCCGDHRNDGKNIICKVKA